MAAVFIRYGFEDVLDTLGVLRWLGRKRRRTRTPETRAQKRAEKLRHACEELGPSYIKLGQLLSTRPDLLTKPFIDELSRLQDQVEPLPFSAVCEVAEEDLGGPLSEIFEDFDKNPVASASLAQVYRARLREGVSEHGGVEVAVKVLKPGVRELVETDTEILTEVADRLSRSALGKRYDFKALSAQLEATLLAELDLRQEGANARRLGKSLEEFPELRVPLVIEELTDEHLLVEEYIHGERLSETDERRPETAEALWRAYLKQVLVDGAFHCDPHPGNFLMDGQGRLVILDHGMFAFMSRENQLRLMALMIMLVEGDGDRAAQACVELGIPGKDFRENRFRSDVGVLVARFEGATLREIPFGELVRQVFAVCFRHDIQIAPEMALLAKTLFNLEPICRLLDPDMDPVRTTREMASRLLEEQIHRDVSAERLVGAILELRSLVNDVPPSFRRVLTRLANNELRIEIELGRAEQMHSAVRQVADRITLGLITAALILGSAELLNLDAGIKIYGYPLFALIGFLLAAGLGIYVVAKILLPDRA